MGLGCDPELRLSLGGRDDEEGSSSNEQCKSARLSRCVVLCLRHGELEARVDDSWRLWLTSVFSGLTIISMARREMDDMMTKKNQQQQPTAPPPPEAVPQILNPGLSMKRSLQRFLQKRKARISDVSPYTQTRKLFFPIESQQA
ncbi:hypothetical protein B296_00025345 [Ensete ventricosum]|uniref:Uncharacterized protein n=1 Tax=Ensete ventricosum TaxID=4639 RepID=A0A426Y308_ENSVE|nr:hypothetical protein B296_00025345 [Ensete ventricosum]